MKHRPTHRLYGVGCRVKVAIELIKAKQLSPVLIERRACIRKAKPRRMRGLQLEEVRSCRQRVVARRQRASAVVRARKKRVSPMSIASPPHQRAHHVHVRTCAVDNPLLQVLHHTQLNIFKRHALRQLLGREPSQYAHEINVDGDSLR